MISDMCGIVRWSIRAIDLVGEHHGITGLYHAAYAMVSFVTAWLGTARGTGRTAVASLASQWAALGGGRRSAVISTADLDAARHAFGRRNQIYLFQLLATIFEEIPTKSAARSALREGRVRLNGSVVTSSTTWAAEPGDSLSLDQRTSKLEMSDDLEKRLRSWNERKKREEAQIRLLHSDDERGWAVVNKPAGLDSAPWAESHSNKRFTFQSYLPTVVPPPRTGCTPCPGPRVCHRLDFRVAGPLVVATSVEAMRKLKEFFARRKVEKEYRAIVCGTLADEETEFTIQEPLDGKACRTDVKVLKVVRCPHFGRLSMLALWPRTGRYRQLRRHLAEVLGRPIVNEDEGLLRAALKHWQGPPLQVSRGRGNLFLQAIQVTVPPLDNSMDRVTVRVAPSDRFEELLSQSQDAWSRGWKTDETTGRSIRLG